MDVKNLSKVFAGRQVIKDVSFSLQKEKVTTFIGSNGAGKSTILNMITRLLKRDSGEVLVDGKDILSYNSNELAKRISILTQSSNVISKITVRELIAFARYPHSKGRLRDHDHEHIHRAIGYMDLEDIQDKYLDELSGGQRQRAFIAMTLCQDTDYIFLDEPTNNLDIYHKKRLMQNIRQMSDDFKKTVVLVLHEINLASFYSDNICAFKDGHLYRAGAVHDVLTKECLKDLYKVDFEKIQVNNKDLFVHY